ncbi:UdgX family uracil-DNA binding protein [Okibacterium endophyticum]
MDRPGADEWVPDSPDVPLMRKAVNACRGCELWKPATQAVFSSGPADAVIMLVGEQPGDKEDREGEPFVGPAGRVLDDALLAAGVDSGSVYLTNAVKHFRFTERAGAKRRLHAKPAVAHIQACSPWLHAELNAVTARVVVCLGATAGRAVLGRPVAINAERGQAIDGPSGQRVVVTTHPSAVLRLRGRDGWDEAFDGLTADLVVAWDLARS